MVDSPRHPAELPDDELLDQCRVERGRRSGPGGQHRNKVETAIRIVHLPSGVTAEATERRSQHANRQVAVSRLRCNLALQVRRARDEREVPSELWLTRVRNRRINVASNHEDFPKILAESLDVLHLFGWNLKPAADALTVTPSQLVRFLKVDPRGLAYVNQQRQAMDLHRLV